MNTMTIGIASDGNLKKLLYSKSQICVSIILPMHRHSPERQTNRLRLVKAISNAREMLEKNYPDSDIRIIIESLGLLFNKLDLMKIRDGIGFFVSQDIALIEHFPFKPTEKTTIGTSFEIRDLIFKTKLSSPYHVLALSKKAARFFHGYRNKITEIKDQNFPLEYEDDYEYSPPVRASSYLGSAQLKGFEKDKSILANIRFKQFYKQIDNIVRTYLDNSQGFLLSGHKKAISNYKNVSNQSQFILGHLYGNYDHLNTKDFGDLCWPVINQYREDKIQAKLMEFKEKIGKGLGLTGIQEMWYAVQEGRALELLVEQDYHLEAYLSDDLSRLYLSPPQKEHTKLEDAVDDLIEEVLRKNGKVFFVEPGVLEQFGRIGLICRY